MAEEANIMKDIYYLVQWFSQHGLQSQSISITWKLKRHGEYPDDPDLLNQNCGGGPRTMSLKGLSVNYGTH